MDNSQSSDFLSESTDIFCGSPNEESANTDVYKSLVFHIKSTFSNIEISSSQFTVIFCDLLDNCNSCILQSLELITNLLVESNVNNDQLIEYINNAICIMQQLADLLSNIVECRPMAYSSMKEFPGLTAHIIMRVFAHCKDSESLYGSQLKNVEEQIKDLFRTCHKLQLIYLMVLEKHCIFDLTENKEHDVLVEVLKINLKIGEIVQSLDVKTMAEQWKAYMMLCEKYSDSLMDKQVYNDCNNVLCTMVTKNIETALKENQEKVIVRSLKVSNFTLKIIQRMCTMFNHASKKDYSKIMDLLIYVNLNNDAHLYLLQEKSAHFTQMYNKNVTFVVDNLLVELVHDGNLLQYICNYNIENIKRTDNLLGYINLVISIIMSLLHKGQDQLAKFEKSKLVNAIFNFLPRCHLWFNIGLKYKLESASNSNYDTYGLYEHLLTHTVAFTCTMTSQEFNSVEKLMMKALLSTDCMSAMFSCNLWMLLARMSSRHLLLSQVISLCKIYQNLESNTMFLDSPQSVHLRHTISELFQVMVDEDKMKLYSMFNICEEKNFNLWICLKISNLPEQVQCNAEQLAKKKLQNCVRQLKSNENMDIDTLIKAIHLASTCTYLSQDHEMEILLTSLWSKACPKNLTNMFSQFHRGMLWCYKYMEVLVALTEAMDSVIQRNSAVLVKVLHIITNIITAGCREFQTLLISILCKLANYEVNDLNKPMFDAIIAETFQDLFTKNDSVVRNKLFNTLRIYKSDNLYRTLSNIVNEDKSLRDMWINFTKYGTLNVELNLKKQLDSASVVKYCHKCLDCKDTSSLVLQKKMSNNFDLDIEMLLEPDEEPACKKSKLNSCEVQDIIARIDRDTDLLCSIKENVFTLDDKCKIKNICDKLNNVIN